MLSNGLVTWHQGIPHTGVSLTRATEWKGAVPFPCAAADRSGEPWNRAVLAVTFVAGIIGAYLTVAEDAETPWRSRLEAQPSCPGRLPESSIPIDRSPPWCSR